MGNIMAQSEAILRAILHGWYLVSMGRDAAFMQHSRVKVKGSIYITWEGDVGYCPF